MASLFSSCFGACQGGSLVPPDHIELSRTELKALYEKSIALNNGKLIVHGIFARADTKNNNKRVYPKYILKREVAKFEQQHISKGTALGELDHPNYASQYFKCLNLPNVSHQVLEVHWKGDQLWGTIEVLPTPSGMLLWELYSQGIKLGVSSRGWASLRTDPKAKCVYVDDDFELITFDFVTEPSTRGAYLVPIRKPYRPPVPDQSKAVQVSHLGHGVVGMAHVGRLPDLPLLVARINELHAAQVAEEMYAAQAAAGLRPPAPVQTVGVGLRGVPGAALVGLRPNGLDQLLRFSHYVVFPHAAYLDREAHARDFSSHLAMFATRAHLADQQQFLNRSDLNAIILREIAREEEAEANMVAAAGALTSTSQGAAGIADGQLDGSGGKAGAGVGGVAGAPGVGLPPMHPNTQPMAQSGSGKLGANGAGGMQVIAVAGSGGAAVKEVGPGSSQGPSPESCTPETSGSASARSSANGAVAAAMTYMHGSVSIGNLNNSGASPLSSAEPSAAPTPTKAGLVPSGSMRGSGCATVAAAGGADVCEGQGDTGRSPAGQEGRLEGKCGAGDLGAWARHPNALDIPSGSNGGGGAAPEGRPDSAASCERASGGGQGSMRRPLSAGRSRPYACPSPGDACQQVPIAAGAQGEQGQQLGCQALAPHSSQGQPPCPAATWAPEAVDPGGCNQTQGTSQQAPNCTAAHTARTTGLAHTPSSHNHHSSGNRVSPEPIAPGAGGPPGSGTIAVPGSTCATAGKTAGPQGSVSERVIDEVAVEFQRIKSTLASFAAKYNSQQHAMMRAFAVQLPLPAGGGGAMAGLGLTGSRA